ncbi:hypothetical protein V2J09_021746, partial [Rumex salicifolius]
PAQCDIWAKVGPSNSNLSRVEFSQIVRKEYSEKSPPDSLSQSCRFDHRKPPRLPTELLPFSGRGSSITGVLSGGPIKGPVVAQPPLKKKIEFPNSNLGLQPHFMHLKFSASFRPSTPSSGVSVSTSLAGVGAPVPATPPSLLGLHLPAAQPARLKTTPPSRCALEHEPFLELPRSTSTRPPRRLGLHLPGRCRCSGLRDSAGASPSGATFSFEMLCLKCPAQGIPWGCKSNQLLKFPRNIIVCATKGPRPRFPRVWKSKTRIGTISKSRKLVDCIKELSNIKEEVYGALDAFVAWELEFPLITVKKAIKTLEDEKDWKRIIQMTKWMLSKGQGRTMGSYYTLLRALAKDGRIEEAEELWTKLFSEHLESMPRMFFDKMINIYHQQSMHDKMFEVFADMEELGIRPTTSIIQKVGDVFQKLGMLDKYEKLKKKYPPPKWEYRYIKGKRVKIRAKNLKESNDDGSDGEHIDEAYKEIAESKDDTSRSNEDSSKQSMDHLDSSRQGSIEEVNQTGDEIH